MWKSSAVQCDCSEAGEIDKNLKVFLSGGGPFRTWLSKDYEVYKMTIVREFVCSDCGSRWQARFLVNRTGSCPQCGGANIQKVDQSRGWARFRKGSSKDRGRRWIR